MVTENTETEHDGQTDQVDDSLLAARNDGDFTSRHGEHYEQNTMNNQNYNKIISK